VKNESAYGNLCDMRGHFDGPFNGVNRKRLAEGQNVTFDSLTEIGNTRREFDYWTLVGFPIRSQKRMRLPKGSIAPSRAFPTLSSQFRAACNGNPSP
jgi:hypothetical protein